MQQADLSPSHRELLVKLCGMLASDFDGERAAAALKASRFLRERALTWGEVIAPDAGERIRIQTGSAAPRPSRPPPGSLDWRADLAMCRNCREWLTDQERALVDVVASSRRRPDRVDGVTLARIARRLRMECWRSGPRGP